MTREEIEVSWIDRQAALVLLCQAASTLQGNLEHEGKLAQVCRETFLEQLQGLKNISYIKPVRKLFWMDIFKKSAKIFGLKYANIQTV